MLRGGGLLRAAARLVADGGRLGASSAADATELAPYLAGATTSWRTTCCSPVSAVATVTGQRHTSSSRSASDGVIKTLPTLPPSPVPKPSGNAAILDGRHVASEWQAELKVEAAAVSERLGRQPRLRVILVGNRPDSCLYVYRKLERCREVGVEADVQHMATKATQEELMEAIRTANEDDNIDAILVQLPLPPHMDESEAVDSLRPEKDVDGFHPLNMGMLMMRGRTSRLVPCTALGCLELLHRSGVDVRGKTAVVLGDSNIVGAPLSIGLLREHGAGAVTVVNRNLTDKRSGDPAPAQSLDPEARVRAGVCGPAEPSMRIAEKQPYADIGFLVNLPEITRTADILVVAIGSPEIVKADWVKPGAVVLDVGINVISGLSHTDEADLSKSSDRLLHHTHGGGLHIVGDVAFDAVSHVASAITPVPGGIGPMTIAAVLHNTDRKSVV